MTQRPYRGKRIDNGEWVYGCLVNNLFFKADTKEPIPYIINPDEYPEYDSFADMEDLAIQVDPDTVGQYIGTNDKQGTKIFEGDILEAPYMSKYAIGVVYWNKNHWAIRERYGAITGIGFHPTTGDLAPTILGNRWDHPHLLEVSKK